MDGCMGGWVEIPLSFAPDCNLDLVGHINLDTFAPNESVPAPLRISNSFSDSTCFAVSQDAFITLTLKRQQAHYRAYNIELRKINKCNMTLIVTVHMDVCELNTRTNTITRTLCPV